MNQRKKPRVMTDEASERTYASYGLLIFFAILAIIGLNAGEPAVILEQATKICLNCIGIG